MRCALRDVGAASAVLGLRCHPCDVSIGKRGCCCCCCCCCGSCGSCCCCCCYCCCFFVASFWMLLFFFSAGCGSLLGVLLGLVWRHYANASHCLELSRRRSPKKGGDRCGGERGGNRRAHYFPAFKVTSLCGRGFDQGLSSYVLMYNSHLRGVLVPEAFSDRTWGFAVLGCLGQQALKKALITTTRCVVSKVCGNSATWR